MPLPRQLPRQVKNELPWWPDWVIDAECRKYDPELFFELGNNGRDRRRIAYAKWICKHCPVIELCLRDNIAVPYGIFAGMTPGERLGFLGYQHRLKNQRGAYGTFLAAYSARAKELLKGNTQAKSPKAASELLTALRGTLND